MNNKNSDFLITEYSAISSYFNTVINFRFLIFGFFIAFIGVIISGEFNILKAMILIIIASFLWILELRNRGLATTLTNRERQIEDAWNKKKYLSNDFFNILEEGEMSGGETRIFGRLISNRALLEYKGKTLINHFPNIQNQKTLKNKEMIYKYYFISHSFIFDTTYFLVILFSFIYLLLSLIFIVIK